MAANHPIAALHPLLGCFQIWRCPNNYTMMLTLEDCLLLQVDAPLIDIMSLNTDDWMQTDAPRIGLLLFNTCYGAGPDIAKPKGARLHTVVNIRSPIGKTSAPRARQHDNLGLLHSFGGEVFDDLTDDHGSHESILSWEEEHKQDPLEAFNKLEC